MSRLAASSVANLANDLSHALDVAEATNADLLQQLEEAEAVIAKVRKVRARVAGWERGAEADAAGPYGTRREAEADAYGDVLWLLSKVDGL